MFPSVLQLTWNTNYALYSILFNYSYMQVIFGIKRCFKIVTMQIKPRLNHYLSMTMMLRLQSCDCWWLTRWFCKILEISAKHMEESLSIECIDVPEVVFRTEITFSRDILRREIEFYRGCDCCQLWLTVECVRFFFVLGRFWLIKLLAMFISAPCRL